MVLALCMTGHANRDLHRNHHTLLRGTCRPFVGKGSGAIQAQAGSKPLFSLFSRRSKVKVMDTRTLLILGLGILILLLLGFFALPA